MGAEKFFDIKCRYGGLTPSAVVLVATARALKYNGGVPKDQLNTENLAALQQGIVNLGVHIANMRRFGLPVVVAINRFPNDTPAELQFIEEYCRENGAEFSLSEVFAKGGEGGLDLAKKVCAAADTESNFQLLYPSELPLVEKLDCIARQVYGADGVELTSAAKKSLAEIQKLGGDSLPVCVAKTQYSLSDNPALLGKPLPSPFAICGFPMGPGLWWPMPVIS